jgi:hypothetical protein
MRQTRECQQYDSDATFGSSEDSHVKIISASMCFVINWGMNVIVGFVD